MTAIGGSVMEGEGAAWELTFEHRGQVMPGSELTIWRSTKRLGSYPILLALRARLNSIFRIAPLHCEQPELFRNCSTIPRAAGQQRQ